MTPAAIAALVGLAASKQISVGAARQVLDRLVAEGGDPRDIVAELGLAAMGATEDLGAIVAAALAANADAAERVRAATRRRLARSWGT